MIYVTRKEHFNAAHKLYNPGLSQAENERIFGKCANENFHGHNYDLFVTIKGKIDPETGYLVDLKALSRIIKERVVSKLDHKNINMDVDFMRNKMASTENLAIGIWEQLEDYIPGSGKLHCIKLYETERNFATYYGE